MVFTGFHYRLKKNILPETLVQVMVSSFALFLVLGGIGYLLWIIYKETVKIREHLDKLDHRLEEIDQDE